LQLKLFGPELPRVPNYPALPYYCRYTYRLHIAMDAPEPYTYAWGAYRKTYNELVWRWHKPQQSEGCS